MVFSSIWGFIKRHRRKFIFTGLVVSGGVLLYKYAQDKLKELQEKESTQCLIQARKQHHFDSNQRTCNMTVLSMLPSIRESLMRSLDSEILTAQLKAKPANKIELWEQLKITSFTRSVCGTYVACMLVVFLRVQLNIIGGYMYIDNLLAVKNNMTEETSVATPTVQHRYLELVQYLLNDGLSSLIEAVRPVVEDVIGSLPLRQTLSLQDVDKIFNDIRQKLEDKRSDTKSSSKLCEFIMSEDQGSDQAQQLTPEEKVLFKMSKETQDIIKSVDFQHVLGRCLDVAFSRLLDKVADFFKSETTNGFVNVTTAQVAMAKLIPVINGLVHVICANAPNPFMQELLLLEPVKDLAANIYEAFSHQEGQGVEDTTCTFT